MGFLAPKLPPRFDVLMWYLNMRAERLKPLVKHWAEYGIGMPWGMYVLYWVKLVGYVAGGLAFIQLTPGIGPVADIANWWWQPVVLQKAVLWTLGFEVLGLGCGFGPLTARFVPPVGGPLYFARPGTIRQPPWGGKLPLTGGDTRTWVDALLYVGLLFSIGYALLCPADYQCLGLNGPVHMLNPHLMIPIVVLIPLLGLRDKTVFLAARPEHFWFATAAMLLPFLDTVAVIKLLTVFIWLGAATSKLNRMFPFVIQVMLSNSPVMPRFLKRRLYREFPDDVLPSGLTRLIAYGAAAVEFGAPLVLLLSSSSTVTTIAALVMIAFHLQILLAMPIGVPLEWNVFMLFSAAWLFLGHPDQYVITAQHPWCLAVFGLPVLLLIAWGNLRPDQVSFLLSMRYYAGNWSTSIWLFERSGIDKVNRHAARYGGFIKDQLKVIYGEQIAEWLAHKIYTFRLMHHHGRALFALLPRANRGHEDAVLAEGEMVAGSLLGWNFGDGHLHREQLIESLQRRCRFEPGELRVVLLEARPIDSDRQWYRLVDAATGQFEQGYVLVSDLVNLQPWEYERLPVHVIRANARRAG